LDDSTTASESASTTIADTEFGSLIGEIGAGELSLDAFSQIATAAYSSPGGLDKLRSLIGEWEALGVASATTSGVLLGYCQFIAGDFAGACDTLQQHEHSEWACYYLARALTELGQPAAAMQVAEEAYKQNSDFIPAAYTLVDAYCRSGRVGETGPVMEALSQRDGESSRFALACGVCQERSGEYREAIDSYRRATELDAENFDAHFRLGYLLDLYGTSEEEQQDDAVHAFERCLEQVPIHTNAVINLGLLYEDRERYHDAVKCFEAVLRHHPNHARAKLYLDDAVAATSMFYDKEQEKKADRHSQVLKIPVSDFELSVRSRNCLAKMNIDTLGDLIMKTEQELLSYKNFGETSLQEIKEMLAQKGLRLGQGLEEQGAEPPSGRNPLEATASPDVLDQGIDDLNLSVRSRRCMERLNVRSVRDLINKTEVELMSAKNFGMTSLNEINVKLKELGLALRT